MARSLYITIPLVLLVGVGAIGCGGEEDLDGSQTGDGPRIVRSVPEAGGEIERAERQVSLQFDRELDTGATVSVEFDGRDVVAKAPVLSADRRKVDTTIDVEGTGTYHVTWRACSATAKTRCSEGTFGFRAAGS